jgi:phosphoribosylamine--glycine ligase
VVSNEGDGSDIVYQLKLEGNDVKFFIQDPTERDVLDGFVDKIDDWESQKTWADIIIFDDTYFGFRQNELRQQGFKVIGGSYLGDQLELDRRFGLDYFKKMNVKTLDTFDFDSFTAAKKFLKDQKKRFIIKFDGIAGEEKSLVYLAQLPDNSDLIRLIDHYSKKWNTAWGEPRFILQEVAEGVETAITAFFNGEKFIMPVYMNFENKRFLTGNLGVMTGEMGTHGFFTFDKLKLFKNTLKKIEEDLKKDGYVGTIDVNCIINEDGIWPLEFTSRFGYPLISLIFEALRDHTRVTDLMVGLVNKTLDFIEADDGYQIGVAVCVPTFPYADGFERYGKDIPVMIMKDDMLPHFHTGDLKKDNDIWVAAGSVGWGFVVTGRGDTIFDAKTQAYSSIKNVLVPNAIYRIDISDRWLKDYPKLHRWGYI